MITKCTRVHTISYTYCHVSSCVAMYGHAYPRLDFRRSLVSGLVPPASSSPEQRLVIEPMPTRVLLSIYLFSIGFVQKKNLYFLLTIRILS